MLTDSYPVLKYCFLLVPLSILISACEQDGSQDPATTGHNKVQLDPVIQSSPSAPTETIGPEISINEYNGQNSQFNIGNKSYLFDVSNHSIEELEALLGRAEEITQANSGEYDQLDIVMILHGPDIEWFTRKNYERNKKLIELAARLDTYEIIDMKVCETAMSSHGVSRDEIPAFIESVPYAPDEIERLLNDDYINL